MSNQPPGPDFRMPDDSLPDESAGPSRAPADRSPPDESPDAPGAADDREALVTAARAMFAAGYSRQYAVKKLFEAGCPTDAIGSIVGEAWRAYVGEQRQTGLVQTVVGGMMLAVGVGITVAVAQQAAEGGGAYVIMTGLIVFGAWNLFRGLVRLIGGR